MARRWRPTFSLRTTLVLMLLAGIGCQWWLNRLDSQRAAKELSAIAQAEFVYDDEDFYDTTFRDGAVEELATAKPTWRRMGTKSVVAVRLPSLAPGQLERALPLLKRMRTLKYIELMTSGHSQRPWVKEAESRLLQALPDVEVVCFDFSLPIVG